MNIDQDRQMLMVDDNIGNQNQNGLSVVPGIAKQQWEGNVVIATTGLRDNLQKASTLGTQSDKAPVYDSDGSVVVSEQKDMTKVPPKVVELNDLSNPITSNSVPTTNESKVVENNKVITPGMFRIDPYKTSREVKFVPVNKFRASIRTNAITVSQPHVITKKEVNSDSNGLSSIGVDNTAKTRRPQPRSNTKNDRVPSASKSSCSKNKEVKVEEHPRNLLLSKNKKHMSFECNNIKLAIRNDKSKVICAMCCSKHTFMTENLKLLINFVWKFLGIVRFRNDHVAAILGFSDLQWGNILITRVYFIEGLGHNLFLVGQFCDSDLEVAFRRNTYFVRNLEGVDLLKGNRTTNLYIIYLHEMAYASLICDGRATLLCMVMASTFIHLNFDTKRTLPKTILSLVFQNSNIIKNIFVPHVSKEKAKGHHTNLKTIQILNRVEGYSFTYGFVWSNENHKHKWKAVCSGDCG
ncbi:hypothetical protein Tco_0789311 [Tanacetum coccineum]